MAFDLFITFAGLCLFRRPKKEEEKWIEVLLPPTGEHEHCCKDASNPASKPTVPGHFAKLGYHVRYDPGATGTPGNRFREFDFEGKHLDLGSLGNPETLNREFRQLDVVDITDVVTKPLNPGCAIGRVTIRAGSLCPGAVCEHSRGARWEFPDKKPAQHMSTLVTWRIRNVKETVQGGEGLELVVTDLKSRTPERCAILRPVDGQIRIYLFHTPYDELPSQGVPPFQTWTQEEPDPTKAEHFRAYYDLFPGHKPAQGDVPVFVDEGNDEDDFEPVLALFAGTPDAKLMKLHRGFGRRYNCILTVVDDGGEG